MKDQDTLIKEERNDAPTLPNKVLARRFLLEAWRSELIGNHNQARRLKNIAYGHDGSLKLSEPRLVEVDGFVYSRTCEVQRDIQTKRCDRSLETDDQIVDKPQRQQIAFSHPKCDEAIDSDISLPRCVTYEYLCNSQIWIADVLNSPELSLHYFQQSKPIQQKIKFFISHCWTDDDCQSDTDYGNRKIVEFQNQIYEHILPSFFSSSSSPLRCRQRTDGYDLPADEQQQQQQKWLKEDATFWIDKACIPQFDEDKQRLCILRLEEFIQRSEGLLVLMNGKYLNRLWCIFEWACFFVFHHPRSIFIGYWYLGTTLSSLPDRLKEFRLANLKCTVETDRKILTEKVLQHYKSVTLFERFGCVTVLALVVRDLYRGIAKSNDVDYQTYARPLLDLASSLGFDQLRDLLVKFDAPTIFQSHGQYDGEDSYVRELHNYFEEIVYPYLLEERCSAIRTKSTKENVLI